ncbi:MULTISPECIES: hypothetical protein [Bacillus]|uniref:hypothetical protein n=1 Tax=Bacillus TaxID=1386 RepID=UPI00028D7D5B|nr:MULTISPECIES: hypothetical protein [Bacillus]EKF35640.1 hypothetical protein BA1_09166 [Bacillus xiamenensis]QGX65980.1 hypothetical protein GPA07_11235 [Bacillus sp. ms-22]
MNTKTDIPNLTDEDYFSLSQNTYSEKKMKKAYVALISSFEGKSKDALVQRLNENATMLTNATENRSAFLRSIKTK